MINKELELLQRKRELFQLMEQHNELINLTWATWDTAIRSGDGHSEGLLREQAHTNLDIMLDLRAQLIQLVTT